MILKHYSLKLIFESASDYFVDYINHLLNLINTFLVIQVKLQMYILLMRKIAFDKLLITGDFNAQGGEKCSETFLNKHELKSFNNEATCYRNPNQPSCIDLILTNSPRNFFSTETYFTGIPDCHKLVLFVSKPTFSKAVPKEMMYRDYKNFDQDIYSQELCTSLSSETVLDYNSFEENFVGVLNKYAPLRIH